MHCSLYDRISLPTKTKDFFLSGELTVACTYTYLKLHMPGLDPLIGKIGKCLGPRALGGKGLLSYWDLLRFR